MHMSPAADEGGAPSESATHGIACRMHQTGYEAPQELPNVDLSAQICPCTYVEQRIVRCWRHRDYASAVYLTGCLPEATPYRILLMGILHYENGDYSQALLALTALTTHTAVFYTALAHQKRQEYSAAISALETLIKGTTTPDMQVPAWLSTYLVVPHQNEHISCLLGELQVLAGDAEAAIDSFKTAMAVLPVLPAARALYDEGVVDACHTSANDPIMQLYHTFIDVEHAGRTNGVEALLSHPAVAAALANGHAAFNSALDESVSFKKPTATAQLKYTAEATCAGAQHSACSRAAPESTLCAPHTPAHLLLHPAHAHVLNAAAILAASFCWDHVARRLFTVARSCAPHSPVDIDAFSSLLWKLHDEHALGALAKDLTFTHPAHPATWVAVGNYYSLRRKTRESMLAFKKSIALGESAHAYALLGFECNTRSQYLEAQRYFQASLRMLRRNDRAHFGKGLAHAETAQRALAELHFQKAMAINPFSMAMQAYIVRFHVRGEAYEKAAQCIREFLALGAADGADAVRLIEQRVGTFHELEELILCEYAEVLLRGHSRELAERILNSVSCRTSTYFAKKALLEADCE